VGCILSPLPGWTQAAYAALPVALKLHNYEITQLQNLPHCSIFQLLNY
jgi:hypothetical protein